MNQKEDFVHTQKIQLDQQQQSKPPTITVEAACSKHRKEDTLPIHPELLVELRIWLRGMDSNDKLFPKLEKRKTWLCVKKDSERVGIPYENEEGVADFHAAGRHSYITGLLESGASVAEAKELARHSDVRMTMKYAHIGIESQSKALSSLPSPKKPCSGFVSNSSHIDSLLLESTDGDCHDEGQATKKIAPEKNGSYDTNCHQATSTGINIASVEAAGIEPASRDISVMASTCVADYLSFAQFAVNRQTENQTRRKLDLTQCVSDMTLSDPELRRTFKSLWQRLSIRVAMLRSQSQIVIGK